MYLLDLIRTYFSNIPLPDVEQVLFLHDKTKAQSLTSIAQSLSLLMYNVLIYSLIKSSKAVQPCEHDIHVLVKALCTCQLGSLGAHVILISSHRLSLAGQCSMEGVTLLVARSPKSPQGILDSAKKYLNLNSVGSIIASLEDCSHDFCGE